MLSRILTQRSVQVLLLLCILGGALFLQNKNPELPFIKRLQFMTFDYYNMLMPRAPGDGVVIVDIDEESLKPEKGLGQWPWSRVRLAALVKQLNEMGAASVAFDMVFAEEDRTSPRLIAENLVENETTKPIVTKLKELPDNETVFAEAIRQAGNVVLGFVGADQHTGKSPYRSVVVGGKVETFSQIVSIKDFTVPLEALSQPAAGNGSFTAQPESDGVVRRVPLLLRHLSDQYKDIFASMYPSLSLEAMRVASGSEGYRVTGDVDQGQGIKILFSKYKVPVGEDGKFWVYYSDHPEKSLYKAVKSVITSKTRPDLYIPVWQVFDKDVDVAERIRNKIVLIGTSAIGLLDLRSSPLASVMPGVQAHAEIIEQVFQKKFLQRTKNLEYIETAAMLAISLFIIFLAPFIGAGLLAFIVMFLISGAFVGSLYAYQIYGLLMAPLYPSLVIVTIFIVSSILTNLRTEMEKRAVRTAFGHYISPVLMEELSADPEKLKLGGEVREITTVFTDIRGFTGISESLTPEELIHLMNDFLTPMTSCVLDNRGTIDKYMGDAMMAFWNAPLDDPAHARHACTAALKMLDELDALNARLKEEGRNVKPLRAGIGINTGEASVGNMGSKQRFAYSVLGDSVNLASRLEGQTKTYGIQIMIAENTYQAIPDFATLEIDLLTVKGKQQPERVYVLLGDADAAADEEFKKLHDAHQSFLTAYRRQDWKAAETLAEKCAGLRPDLTGLYNLYKTRIATYRKTPPPSDWTGVFVATEK